MKHAKEFAFDIYHFLKPRRKWLFLPLCLFFVGGGVLTGLALTYFQDLPQVKELESFQPKVSTRIYGADGSLIYEFAEQRRVFLPHEKIPENFINAVIATEDSRFYEHWGVDMRGIARAFLKNLRAGGVVEGGSSITQQLSKLLFLTHERTFARKIKEAILAFQIEMRYSKEKIFELYTNQVYMGNGIYGLEASAQYYFGKSADELSLNETALLVGLLKNPGRYNPYENFERALVRRDIVLKRLVAEGFLTEEEAENYKNEPIILKPREKKVTAWDYFTEEVRRDLMRRFGAEKLYGRGLRVRTTLNPEHQKFAETALKEGLRRLDKEYGKYRGALENISSDYPDLDGYSDPQWKSADFKRGDIVRALVVGVKERTLALRVGSQKAALGSLGAAWARIANFVKIFKKGDIILARIENIGDDGAFELSLEQEPQLQGAIIAMDPKTGAVSAMVGGYKFEASEFNRATQARRQTGSAFKPIVYTAALEAGWTPSSLIFDEPTLFFDGASGQPYFPENYEKDFEGLTTVRRAIEKSRNVAAVKILNQIGIKNAIKTVRRFGFEGYVSSYPALALGASEATLIEMTTAFSAFANGGLRPAPFLIEEIALPNGETERFSRSYERVTNPETAFIMAQMLRGVVERGTAARARWIPAWIAGKTGTTNDYTDAWFIGFSPDIIVGVWVGYDMKLSMGRRMVGAHAALPVWMDFLNSVIPQDDEEYAQKTLPRPDGVVFVPTDINTGLRATLEAGCETVVLEAFVRGKEPIEVCSASAHEFVSLDWISQRDRLMARNAPFSQQALSLAAPKQREALVLLSALVNTERFQPDVQKEIRRIGGEIRYRGVPVAIEPIAY